MKAVTCPLIDRPCKDERCVETNRCYYYGNGSCELVAVTTEMPARDKQSCMSNERGAKRT